MGDFYSISGMFFQRFPRGFFTFGGAFVREDNGVIIGSLIDDYGFSGIEGSLNDFKFEFKKRYHDRKDIINYEFEFDEKNNLWKGKYLFPGLKELGAICKIHKDFEGLKPAIRGPDSIGKDLLNMMVEDGYVEIIKDPKTGEEFVKPL